MNVTQEVLDEIFKCPKYITFGSAWAIQHTMNDQLVHEPKCSSVEGWCSLSGPCFLCDCGAIEKCWEEIVIKKVERD